MFSHPTKAQDEPHLYPIVVHDKLGFIDSGGKERVLPQFGGYACSFRMLPQFSEGLARVEIGQRLGYIDRTGKLVLILSPQSIDPKQGLFTDGKAFHDGIAVAETYSSAMRTPKRLVWIDRSGKMVFAKDADQLPTEFHEGLLRLSQGNNWGYVDHDFHWVIRPQFQRAEDFNEGLALVWIDSGSSSDWAYIDKTGAIAFKQKGQSSYASSFSGELALIEVVVPFSGSNVGGGVSTFEYVDRSGHDVIGPLFCLGSSFSEGYAFTSRECKEKGMAIIDKRGSPLTKQEFDAFPSTQFHEGLAPIRKGGVYGYIDPTGRWVISPQFDEAYSFSNGLALVVWVQKREWAYVDRQGRVVWKGTDSCQYPPP